MQERVLQIVSVTTHVAISSTVSFMLQAPAQGWPKRKEEPEGVTDLHRWHGDEPWARLRI